MSAVRTIPREVRDIVGEGPLWAVREQAVYWVDIIGQQLHRYALTDETINTWDIPEMIGWVIEREGGGFVAGLQSGFVELDLDPFAIRPIADPEPDRPDNRLNDAKADKAGRIWAGTMPVAADAPCAGLYRLDPDRRVTTIDHGYTIANGPAFSPDERWLYHSDTKLGLIYRYPLIGDGVVGTREPFIEFESGWGGPDGMTVDADGGLWVAHWGAGRASRFHDNGRLDRFIELPTANITSCTFAGDDLDRMFVTSAAYGRPDDPLAGALFEVDTGRRGLMPNRSAI